MLDLGTTLSGVLAEYSRRISNPHPFQHESGAFRNIRAFLKGSALRLARRGGLFWWPKAERSISELSFVFGHLPEFESLRASLADQQSRDNLIEVLAMRILGPYYVQTRMADTEFWERFREVHPGSLKKRNSVHEHGIPGCNYYEFSMNGRMTRCHASPFGIMTIFTAEQYAYRTAEDVVTAGDGDVVLDGGGYLGETGLYFANRVGPNGRVFVFEFNDSARKILAENVKLNADSARIIDVVPLALWSESKVALSYRNRGPGTSIARDHDQSVPGPRPGLAETISIDDFIAQRGLNQVDFLKLDVEGAELRVLQGAEASLRRFKPRLAVSVYHRIEDFLDIPRFLQSLELGYRYYLRHASIDETETVLFAAP